MNSNFIIENQATDIKLSGGEAIITNNILNKDYVINSSTLGPLTEVIGSFYECSSKDDQYPILIASGSPYIEVKLHEKQKCTNWGFLAKLALSTGIIDDIYVATDKSQGCFNSIKTYKTKEIFTDDFCGNKVYLPPIAISCLGDSCNTTPFYANYSYLKWVFPSTPVNCLDDGCHTINVETAKSIPFEGCSITLPTTLIIDKVIETPLNSLAGDLSNLCLYEIDHLIKSN